MQILESLFGGKELRDFAVAIARDLAKQYPPALANDPKRMFSEKRTAAIIEAACLSAVEYAKKSPLNSLKKAKLANTFRWELNELGFNDGFVEVATEALLVYVTRRPQ
jgi:hypothetical protein